MNGLKKYFTVFIILSYIFQTKAQEAGIKIDFFGYADNREYKASHTTPKTIFGTRISPEGYILLDNNHKLVGGIHYKQDFGDNTISKINGVAYYNYSNKSIDFNIGLIPRLDKLKEIPRIVLADTFLYDRPNIEGMHFQYAKNNKRQALYIDWLNKQSKTTREQFIVGTNGFYKWDNVYFTNDALLYHNALTSNDSLNEHIQDNFILTASLGYDLSKNTFLDSLTIDAGLVFSKDRLRTIYNNSAKGFISNIHIAYKHFFIKNTIYLGDALNLPNGDPFYHRKRYDRLDLGWIPFRNKNIEGKFTATFHFRKSGMDNQQAFTLYYNFGRQLWKNKKI